MISRLRRLKQHFTHVPFPIWPRYLLHIQCSFRSVLATNLNNWDWNVEDDLEVKLSTSFCPVKRQVQTGEVAKGPKSLIQIILFNLQVPRLIHGAWGVSSNLPGPRWEVQRWKGPIPPWIWQVFLPWPAQLSNYCSSYVPFFFAGASSCQVNPSALTLASARWPDWLQFTILIAVNINVKYIGNGMGMACQYHVEWAKAVLKVRSETKPCMTFCEFAWAQVTVILFRGSCWPAPSHLWNCRDSTASGPEKRQAQGILMNTGNIYLCRLPPYQNSLDKCASNSNFAIQGAKW